MNIVLAAIALAAAVYTQWQIPRFTASRASIIAARGILAAVGAAFGYVTATLGADEHLAPIVAFIIGFGAVHVPAALILLIKTARHAGRS
ncbi:MAG TPA: hypothetical protein VED01_22725 [Burkholderiales bacterium]|nr:hypothetical protein [Burkholderiales bacterium]